MAFPSKVHVDEIEMELEEDQFLCSPPWDEEGDDTVLKRPLDYMVNGLAVEGTWLEEGDVAIYSETDGRVRTQKLPVGVRGGEGVCMCAFGGQEGSLSRG